MRFFVRQKKNGKRANIRTQRRKGRISARFGFIERACPRFPGAVYALPFRFARPWSNNRPVPAHIPRPSKKKGGLGIFAPLRSFPPLSFFSFAVFAPEHNPEKRARQACVVRFWGRTELACPLRSKPVIFDQYFTGHCDSVKISGNRSVLHHGMNQDIHGQRSANGQGEESGHFFAALAPPSNKSRSVFFFRCCQKTQVPFPFRTRGSFWWHKQHVVQFFATSAQKRIAAEE